MDLKIILYGNALAWEVKQEADSESLMIASIAHTGNFSFIQYSP
jgi:hypothetical protein